MTETVASVSEQRAPEQAKAPKSPIDLFTTYLKYIVSSVVTITYLVYIFWGIWTNEAVLPVHYVAHFVIFIFCMTMVFYLEGLQVAILAVEHEDYTRYKDIYPRAYALMKSATHLNNVERFLVGRQFCTIFVMTLIAQVTTFPKISHLGINSIVWFIFIQTGLPGAIVVTTIASLQPQLLAAKDPWKFLNLYGMHATLNLCYALEISGICTHYAYLLLHLIRATIFRSDIPASTDERVFSPAEWALEIFKYILSTAVIFFYLVYIMWGIWTGQAVLPIHPVAVFIVFVLAGVFLAHLEGIQVGILVAEPKNHEEYKDTYPRGYAMMKRATFEKNVRRFLIGRQFFVIFVVFLINQCTIFPEIATFGTPGIVWLIFFQLGFPTAINVLCWCQLPTQLLANQDPFMFMNRFGPRFTLEVCLFTEITGLAHFSWVVSAISRMTWFRINQEILSKRILATGDKHLEMIESGDKKPKQKNDHFETKELQLELHTDLAHALNDENNI
jgi:hypothetical protein